jgi:membrane-associated protease RseP (regulator of RpoE activity)
MVWPDSIAAAAGLASGDRIVDIDGVRPAGRSELRALLAATEWRQRVSFLVERGGQQQEVAMLLYPQVDLSEPATAPGWSIATAADIDPEAGSPVVEATGEPHPRSILVRRDGVPQWVELRTGDALGAVHEVDGDGRVVRSVYRTPQADGAVEVRYRRAADGSLASSVRVDRTGRELGP